MDPNEVSNEVRKITNDARARWNDGGFSAFSGMVNELTAILGSLQGTCNELDRAVHDARSDLRNIGEC